MRGLLVLPLVIMLSSAIGWVLCVALGWNPHPREMASAAFVMLVAACSGAVVLLLVRHRTQPAIAQAALVGISLHLFVALALGGVIYVITFAPQTPFVYWLLLDYWVTLPLIAAAFIRALRSAAVHKARHSERSEESRMPSRPDFGDPSLRSG